MFRKMRRFKQQLEEVECKKILQNNVRGVLSLIGDEGYPYGIPIDYYYNENENALFFHGAKEGHKIDSIKKCEKASFAVIDLGNKSDGEWWYRPSSVIIFGKMSFVDDLTQCEKICRTLAYKFSNNETYIDDEIARSLSRVLCLKLTVEHMTGKKVEER